MLIAVECSKAAVVKAIEALDDASGDVSEPAWE